MAQALIPDPGRTGFVDVPELRIDDRRWYSWDEAIEVERTHWIGFDELVEGRSWSVIAEAGQHSEDLFDGRAELVGRLVRRRWGVRASASARVEPVNGLYRLSVSIDNEVAAEGLSKAEVLRRSMVGTHVIVESMDPKTRFVSVIDPPDDATKAAAELPSAPLLARAGGAGGGDEPGAGLTDHPLRLSGGGGRRAPGALFDSTEIDEILTLRIMTMTDEEKAEAAATDSRAREIIERCDQMSPSELQNLHGVLRDPHAGAAALASESIIPEAFADAVAAWNPTPTGRGSTPAMCHGGIRPPTSAFSRSWMRC